MNVTVTSEDLDTIVDHGSVIEVTGTAEDGARVTFAGDHRPMTFFLNAVKESGEEVTDVAKWQIRGTI